MRSLKYSSVVAMMVVLFLTEIYGSPVIHVPTGTWQPNPISMSMRALARRRPCCWMGQTRREKEN